MTEPEVALVFTAEPWVEELHRHLSDHGGARIRSLVVEQSIALVRSRGRTFALDGHSRAPLLVSRKAVSRAQQRSA